MMTKIFIYIILIFSQSHQSINKVSQVNQIRELNLVGNQLRTLDKEVFEPLAKLEVLLLDSNQLEDINGKVSHEADNHESKRDF